MIVNQPCEKNSSNSGMRGKKKSFANKSQGQIWKFAVLSIVQRKKNSKIHQLVVGKYHEIS